MELERRPKRTEGSKNHDNGEENSWLLESLVLEEIMPKLPVESLIKFKLVSKKWFDFITNESRFVSNHLRHQLQTTRLSVILPTNPHTQRVLMLDHHRNRVEAVEISSLLKRFAGKYYRHRMVGSCNGLLCLSLQSSYIAPPIELDHHFNKREAVVLWNPETGEARDTGVPRLSSSFYEERTCRDYPVYGFGFDEPRNDYKVVRIVPTQLALLNFDVFSRNSGLWRPLEKGLFGYTIFSESFESVELNGCLYWLVVTVENNAKHRRCILSFDLRDDEFRIIDVFKDSVPSTYKCSALPHRLVKWEGNSVAYLSLPAERDTPRSDEFGFRVVINGPENCSSSGDDDKCFFWSSEPLPRFALGCDWKSCGVVSGGRFLVAERSRFENSKMLVKLVMYDPFCRDYESVGRTEVVTLLNHSRYFEAAHDYVRSLVSVFPDRKMMVEEKNKMKVRFWAHLFWKKFYRTKDQFGLLLE